MTDCEGKDVQVGDAVVIWYGEYRVGKHLCRGKVSRITKAKIEVEFIDHDDNFGTSNYFPREVFKI
jgi:hypothetical protein